MRPLVAVSILNRSEDFRRKDLYWSDVHYLKGGFMPKNEPKVPPGMRKIGDMYYAWVQVRGKRDRGKLSTNLTTAKAMLADRLAGLHRGKGRAVQSPRWDDVSKRWLEEQVQAESGSAESYRTDLLVFNAFLKEQGRISRLDELTIPLVRQFREWRRTHRLSGDEETRKRPVAVRTINRTVKALKFLCAWAVRGMEMTANPLDDLEDLPDKVVKKRRALDEEEKARILEKAPPYMNGLIRFLLTTGCRINEAMTLTWDKIDWEKEEVKITADIAKSRRERRIPLAANTLDLLKGLRAAAPDRQPYQGKGAYADNRRVGFSREHVFVSSNNTAWAQRTSIANSFYRICKKAEIPGAERRGTVDLHALRVTFATNALDAGADLLAVSKILGHRDPGYTLRIYDRTTPKSYKAAVAVVDLPPSLIPSAAGGKAGKKGPKVAKKWQNGKSETT